MSAAQRQSYCWVPGEIAIISRDTGAFRIFSISSGVSDGSEIYCVDDRDVEFFQHRGFGATALGHA
jgi:hypothetical protein